MPDASDLLRALGTVLVVVVLLWFAFGTQRNVRKGERAMAWLQRGLPLLGRRTTVRWLGSSVAELRIVEPAAPFRAAVVMVVLEPRDLGALWSFARWRGRRDFLLVRADLVRAPQFRADVIDPKGWTAHDRRGDDAPFGRELTWSDASGRTLMVRHDDAADSAQLRPSWERLDRSSGGAWRISVRQLVPHLEVHAVLPKTGAGDARELIGAVRELAEALVERR